MHDECVSVETPATARVLEYHQDYNKLKVNIQLVTFYIHNSLCRSVGFLLTVPLQTTK